jgi:hypothetical protein
VYLASSPDVADASGSYFDRFTRNAKVHKQAEDPDLAVQLWERCAEMVKRYVD